MRPTKRLTALVSKLSTVRMIDELSLPLSACARSRPILGQGQRTGRAHRDTQTILLMLDARAAQRHRLGARGVRWSYLVTLLRDDEPTGWLGWPRRRPRSIQGQRQAHQECEAIRYGFHRASVG